MESKLPNASEVAIEPSDGSGEWARPVAGAIPTTTPAAGTGATDGAGETRAPGSGNGRMRKALIPGTVFIALASLVGFLFASGVLGQDEGFPVDQCDVLTISLTLALNGKAPYCPDPGNNAEQNQASVVRFLRAWSSDEEWNLIDDMDDADIIAMGEAICERFDDGEDEYAISDRLHRVIAQESGGGPADAFAVEVFINTSARAFCPQNA